MAQGRSIRSSLATVITIYDGEIPGVGRMSRVGIYSLWMSWLLMCEVVILQPRVTRDYYHGRKNGWVNGGHSAPFAVFLHLPNEWINRVWFIQNIEVGAPKNESVHSLMMFRRFFSDRYAELWITDKTCSLNVVICI